MGKRRSGRELAFKLLFQIDVGNSNPDEVFSAARISSEASSEVWVFASQLARGAWEHKTEIDPIIEKYASGWTLERIANADRNLLRLCLYEMLMRDEIPASVSINEAVEMAKKYSTIDSAKFINGILGSFSRERDKESRNSAPEVEAETPLETAEI
ncbi:NusB antitermination factor [Abditibacterium utsteinense]|uniref:Transcription antitermination protein NusB n=1 Tax=Abditibacterium utsteinense TaxID=1960156 RepID=A0A2S8SWT5_9BACT|nr:transcription antitermination factor NusB [Abditibacterium utsteinense]PQV65234.1 NusB antitermination factor [Abditibacterium utsteinense]